MISEVGIDLFRSGCAASAVELDLKKTQRRDGDFGARRAPDEAQERPSLASGTAPEGGPGSEVCKSGQVVQIEPPQGQVGGLEPPSHTRVFEPEGNSDW